jgi:hypothetical protein
MPLRRTWLHCPANFEGAQEFHGILIQIKCDDYFLKQIQCRDRVKTAKIGRN